MPDLRVQAPYEPTGDQPVAIDALVGGVRDGLRNQVLLGATGTGKTYTAAKVIEAVQKPTLVMAHNKTLAAQLYQEFREFFPDNAVEYFVSYYDYFQPEAYLPRSDTYIEKDSSRNDEIDRLRHQATRTLFERRDVIIVASVSCIYGIGAPIDYGSTVLNIKKGGRYRRDGILRHLVDLQYQRNEMDLARSRFRVRGDVLEVQPPHGDFVVRIEFFGDDVERITEIDLLTGELQAERNEVNLYPATHYVTPRDKLLAAIDDIEAEMEERTAQLAVEGRELEAARLRQRTMFDLEMMREVGFCSGIENYSRHLSRREAGSRPWTLIDYFPTDFLLIVDESHITIPQVHGMYKNDRTRKEILVDFGFRLPSALDNRPLTFDEFEDHLNQVIYMSATPGPYETEARRPRGGAVHPAHRRRRPDDHRPPHDRPGRRPAGRDPRHRRAQGAGPRHDADEEDGRGPRRLPRRAGDQGPVAPLRGRHARAGRDPARPAARGVRRARRHQPARARGSTCRRSRWSRSWTRTRRASSAPAGR